MEIPFIKGEISSIDTRQMIELDRRMVEDYKIELIQMMENAVSPSIPPARISILGEFRLISWRSFAV